MKKPFLLIPLLAVSGASIADNWTPQLNVVKIEPLVAWQGGMVRVVVDSAVNTTPCGSSTVFDFLFTGGTQESRSATLSALYMAFAAGKRVQFYVSSATCSPVGAPVITGLDVIG